MTRYFLNDSVRNGRSSAKDCYDPDAWSAWGSNTVSASIVGAPVRPSPPASPVADARGGKPFAPDDSFALSFFDQIFQQWLQEPADAGFE